MASHRPRQSYSHLLIGINVINFHTEERFGLVDVGDSGRKYNYWQNNVQQTNVGGGERKIGIPNKRINKIREDNGGNTWQEWKIISYYWHPIIARQNALTWEDKEE
jgi:hypothetical protein